MKKVPIYYYRMKKVPIYYYKIKKVPIYYYKYHDPVKNADYYHEPISNKVTWNFPLNAQVFDGKTNEIISEPITPDLKPLSFNQDVEELDDFDDQLRIFRTTPIKNKTTPLRLLESNKNTMSIIKGKSSNLLNFQLPPPGLQMESEIIQDTSINSYLPKSYQTDKEEIDIISFLTKYTTAKKKHLKQASHFFSYQETSRKHIPILKSTVEENLSKAAINSFDYILEFCSSGGRSPEKLIKLLTSYKNLVDEVYIQLIKQTHKNENKDTLLCTWYLLILMSTLYDSSPQYKPLIRSTLAQGITSNMREISRCAFIAYLRFVSFHSSLNEENLKPERLSFIINDENHGFSPFHSHLLEIMYHQKNKAPDCPIPIILWGMIYYLIKNKGLETQKLFIKSGAREKVDQIAQKCVDSIDELKISEAENLGGLVKKWISELGQPLVISRLYKEFESEPEKSVEIANKLPQFNKFSVMYIIGFLQEFSKHKDQTKVDEKFILNIFGGLLFPPIEEYSFNAPSCLKIGKTVVKNLIDNWNTKEVYPLPLGLLPSGLV